MLQQVRKGEPEDVVVVRYEIVVDHTKIWKTNREVTSCEGRTKEYSNKGVTGELLSG
ncbi:hypothetical protein Syun_029305 [Stephania yunnanensis]|uniref:Uncharacterized protein n=1 Tax=Stephania yunnanensis TaxID=152371 RepID=A0AAP0HJQ3_9MAGN